MAGIDKTYVKTWEQYKAVKDWVESFKEPVVDDFGNCFRPSDFLIEYTEFEFKEVIRYQLRKYSCAEIIIWNTPTYFDIWLIRNCGISFIQDRLKLQYGSSYESLLNRTSEYDSFKRPAASYKFSISGIWPRIRAYCWWCIQVMDPRGWQYNDETGEWHYYLECKDFNTNTADFRGIITRRKLARIIKKFGFPAGLELRVVSGVGHNLRVHTK